MNLEVERFGLTEADILLCGSGSSSGARRSEPPVNLLIVRPAFFPRVNISRLAPGKLERQLETELNGSRALRAPGHKKIRVVPVNELRAEAEHSIVEEIKNVNGRA